MGDEWLDVNFATSHHGDSCWVAVGVTENASDINLKNQGFDLSMENVISIEPPHEQQH